MTMPAHIQTDIPIRLAGISLATHAVYVLYTMAVPAATAAVAASASARVK